MEYNFSVVEHKLFEADFFLDKMKECSKSDNTFNTEYYFSAFLSSTRSVTFSMQYVFSKIDGFKEWYEIKQNSLKNNELAVFFRDARNNSQKQGMSYLNITRMTMKYSEFYFVNDDETKFAPTGDMIKASENYLQILICIVFDFFNDFAEYVNPRVYYSMENILKRGKTVRELEYDVWGYCKWTGLGLSEEQSLEYILTHMIKTRIFTLVDKYKLLL
jgi:hypothetical protein